MPRLSNLEPTATNTASWIRRAAERINYLLNITDTLLRPAVKAVSADYDVASGDDLLAVDTTSGNVTVTLPMPERGRGLIVKRISGGTNTLTVQGMIDGSNSVTLANQWDVLRLYGRAGGWYAV